MVLSWQENMVKDDMPPIDIWLSDTAISEWFDDLDVRRESKQGNADITGWEQPEHDEFDSNELSDQYRKQMGLK